MKDSAKSFFNPEVCGQQRIAEYLGLSLARQKISHAYLFVGPEGSGKRFLATQFVKAVFCLTEGAKPCGHCSNCLQIGKGSHPDVYRLGREYDEKNDKMRREIVIDQIRDLKMKLQQSSLLSGYKAAIIDEAETINNNAYNSLLKLLEEPTDKTVIILLANSSDAVPETIASRCQTLNFLPAQTEDIRQLLLRRGSDPDVAAACAKAAFGLPGRAVRLAEDEELSGELAGNVKCFLDLIAAAPLRRLQLYGDSCGWTKDENSAAPALSRRLRDWQTVLRDLNLSLNGNDAYLINSDHAAAIKAAAGALSGRAIKSWSAALTEAARLLETNANPKLILENLIIRL